MKEFLYCELVANAHVMSETIWDSFKDEFALIGDSIYLYLGAFKYGAIENQAHKASYGEESGCETFGCSDCIYETDFEAANGYTITSAGSVIDGQAQNSVTGGTPPASFTVTLTVEFVIPDAATVGEITYHFNATSTADAGSTRQMQQFIRGWDGASWTDLYSNTSGDINDQGEWQERTRTFTPDAWEKIELRLFAGWGDWAGGGDNTATIHMDDICIK